MNGSNKTLFLFTDSFPYHTREVYIETEIVYLCKKFKEVIIFPINVEGMARPIPENAKVINIHKTLKGNRFRLFYKAFWLTLKIYLFAKNKKVGFNSFNKSMKLSYNAYLYAIAVEDYIEKQKLNCSQIVIYSYWFLHWSFIVALLKKRNTSLRAYSKAHMGDLYADMCDHTFSEYKLKNLDTLFPISNDGKIHLSNLFPSYAHKIQVSYLGVNHISFNPKKQQGTPYVIVSCSSMNQQKRIGSFFDILSLIKSPLVWVHFGGMESEIKALKSNIDNLPSHIKAVFNGYTPNQKILEYYTNNHVDLFLNLSLSEGIPVTIMEAISFGIPAMATNVCGSPEIVSYDKKMILDTYFAPKETAQLIENFILHESNDAAYRQKVFDFWNSHFNAEINYEAFASKISI
jgi:glycosyltransferase involved in cell wall biosynthesis